MLSQSKSPGDVVRRDREGEDPSLGIALGHDLQKCQVEEIHLVLEFLVRLGLEFAADRDVLIREVLGHRDIERHIRKGRLKADARRHVDIEDEFLKGPAGPP